MVTARYSIIPGDAGLGLYQMGWHSEFDACFCDPPYGITAYKAKGKRTERWERESLPDPILWQGVFDALKPGSLLMAASCTKLYHTMASNIEKAGFTIVDQFNWLYTGANATGVVEGIRLRPACEPYVVAWKPKQPVGRRFNTRAHTRGLPCNVGMDSVTAAALEHLGAEKFFFCGKAPPSERIPGDDHPTHKPLALCEHLAALMRSSPKQMKLLVPFCGVGSEMIGALRAGWPEVIGLERERKYVAVARRRIEKFTPGSKEF